ncbi:MAG: Heat-inducible transcription repressor HrcA, partial [uncultured Rubrobacteraceae bacterium]
EAPRNLRPAAGDPAKDPGALHLHGLTRGQPCPGGRGGGEQLHHQVRACLPGVRRPPDPSTHLRRAPADGRGLPLLRGRPDVRGPRRGRLLRHPARLRQPGRAAARRLRGHERGDAPAGRRRGAERPRRLALARRLRLAPRRRPPARRLDGQRVVLQHHARAAGAGRGGRAQGDVRGAERLDRGPTRRERPRARQGRAQGPLGPQPSRRRRGARSRRGIGTGDGAGRLRAGRLDLARQAGRDGPGEPGGRRRDLRAPPLAAGPDGRRPTPLGLQERRRRLHRRRERGLQPRGHELRGGGLRAAGASLRGGEPDRAEEDGLRLGHLHGPLRRRNPDPASERRLL